MLLMLHTWLTLAVVGRYTVEAHDHSDHHLVHAEDNPYYPIEDPSILDTEEHFQLKEHRKNTNMFVVIAINC